MIFTIITYAAAVLFLFFSFLKSRKRTLAALKKAWKSFENILPQFLGIIILIGFGMAFLDAKTISGLIGKDSGFWGTIVASLVGSITLIPGFIAFPLAAVLLKNGAGYMQIGVFVSTLMMVGVVTFPIKKNISDLKLRCFAMLLHIFFHLSRPSLSHG